MPLRHNARSDNDETRNAWHSNSLAFSEAVMHLQYIFHLYEIFGGDNPRFKYHLQESKRDFESLSNSYNEISVEGVHFDKNYFMLLKNKLLKASALNEEFLPPSHFLINCFTEENVENEAIVLRNIARRTCEHMIENIKAVLDNMGNELPYLRHLVFVHAEVQIIAVLVSALSSGREGEGVRRPMVLQG